MIRVEVLHLKAPWPAGVTVGAVVALAVASLPAWAAGKCVLLPADDEREPVATWEPPQIDSSDPQARAFVVNPAAAADQLAEQAVRVAELGQQLLDAEQALGTALAEIKSLGAQLAEAKGQAEAAARAQLAAEQDSAALAEALARAEQALQAAQQAQQGPAEAPGDAAATAPAQAATKATKKAAA